MTSGSLRSAQTASPIARMRRPPFAFRVTKSSKAGIMSAGFRPSSCISAKVTASEPASSRLSMSPIFSGLTATITGSPAATPSRMNGRVRSRKEPSPK